jgi:hypothetical protein
MARPIFDVSIDLETIVCHDEGDGIGSAEPYLWVVFFRVSGDDVQVVLKGIDTSTSPPTVNVGIQGTPLVQFSPGSHGNLPNDDVDPGEVVPIPTSIGSFSTRLRPIPIPQALRDLAEQAGMEDVPEDLPGFVGAAVVLMEEDNVTDAGAEAGHVALNSAIQTGIQGVIDTRSIKNAGIEQSDIDAITESIDDAVSDAISDEQSFFQNVWAFLNADDQIGNHVFLFNSDDVFANSGELRHRWDNEGDWEVTAFMTASFLCPAEAVADTVKARTKAKFALDDATLRTFRDRELPRFPGTLDWLKLVERNKSEILKLVMRDKGATAAMLQVLSGAPGAVAKPDKKIDPKLLEQAKLLLERLSRSRLRRTRIDAGRSLDTLAKVKGKSVTEALRILDATRPARHPDRPVRARRNSRKKSKAR